MLVKNNLTTVLDFGSPPPVGADVDHKDYSGPMGMNLIPGANEVHPKIWELWTNGKEKCAGLDWHIAKRHIEAVRVEVEPADGDGHSVVRTVSSSDFSELKADDCADLVDETFDVLLLNTWLEAEEQGKNRKTVRAAIDKQVSILEADVSGTEE